MRENGATAFLLNTEAGDLRRALLWDAILDYHDVITRQTRARRFVKLRADASFIPFGIKCRASREAGTRRRHDIVGDKRSPPAL